MVHAKEVVGRILAGETGKVWCGSGAEMVRILERTLPEGLFVSLMGFLDKLSRGFIANTAFTLGYGHDGRDWLGQARCQNSHMMSIVNT